MALVEELEDDMSKISVNINTSKQHLLLRKTPPVSLLTTHFHFNENVVYETPHLQNREDCLCSSGKPLGPAL